MVPPAPKTMVGPKASSVTRPTQTSRPRRARAIFCTVTPLMRACGCSRFTRATISWKVSRAAAPLWMFNATPCTSLLWAMSGESIFSATGKPICVASIMASLALRASIVGVTGMWKAASSALLSISVSVRRRSASTLSISRRAASMSGCARLDSGGGVCSSSCWLA